jgi:hypothetical protein
MSTKKEKKTILNRRLRSEYVVEHSDEAELSDDISSIRRGR